MQKKRRAAIATAAGGVAFGFLLAIIGTVNLITDAGATNVDSSSNGIPNWISGPLLIVVGIGMVIPFSLELRRLLREKPNGLD